MPGYHCWPPPTFAALPEKLTGGLRSARSGGVMAAGHATGRDCGSWGLCFTPVGGRGGDLEL